VGNRQVRIRVDSTTRSRAGWPRLLVALLGGVFGILFSCCLGVAALSLLETASEATPVTSPPTEYGIEAIVEEYYINDVFEGGAAGSDLPEFVAGGHVDVRPGGLIDFAVQLTVGPLRPLLRGTVALQVTEAGELKVTLETLEAGRLSVASLVPDRALDPLNEQINRELIEQTTAMGVRLLAITSDETTLHLYLVSAR
jgi:hypothetical protein